MDAREIWSGPDRMVVDTTGYAVIPELNPAADLGPFEPGVTTDDRTADRLDYLRGRGF